jgi:hypothetical protein
MNMSRLFAIAAAGAVLLLSGCTSAPMGAPQPTIENIARLRGAQLAPARVGSFTFDTGKPAALDQSVSMRGSRLHSPINGSFAQYLGETLRVELAAAGLADPASPTVISGTLSESELDAAIGQGNGKLAARFVVTRADAVRYDRTLTASATWDSSFIGAVAIPLAAGQYQALYRKLAGQLFDDPDFRKALAP